MDRANRSTYTTEELERIAYGRGDTVLSDALGAQLDAEEIVAARDDYLDLLFDARAMLRDFENAFALSHRQQNAHDRLVNRITLALGDE